MDSHQPSFMDIPSSLGGRLDFEEMNAREEMLIIRVTMYMMTTVIMSLFGFLAVY
jgi:hypothetical protein